MKINNNGVTLMELIFSMVLLSLILIFLAMFINNVLFKEKNPEFYDDINASLIIENINEDLIKNGLGYLNNIDEIYQVLKKDNEYVLTFTTINGKSNLTITKVDGICKVSYEDVTNKEFLWTLEKDMYIDFEDINIFRKILNDQYGNIFIKIWIPIYSKNGNDNTKGNNDVKDDIIIEYYGKAIKLEANK